MNEAEQQQIQQMVQGARGGEMPQKNPAQQPPQISIAEVHQALIDMLSRWKPETEEGRAYNDELMVFVQKLGGVG